MNKKFGKRVLLVFGIIILSLGFVFAAHTATPSLGTSYNFNESVTQLYNITINNTDPGQSANITQINITFSPLPPEFRFTLGNGTNRGGVFTNTSTVLSWTNSTGYLINGSMNNSYFWFNATIITPGNYNISIAMYNGTTTQHNISVTINDTIAPAVLFRNPLAGGNYSGMQILNVSAIDHKGTTYVFFNVTNSTGNQVNITVASNTSLTDWNATLNTLGFLDGVYNITAYANDSANKLNSSERVQFTIDNTAPSILAFTSLTLERTSLSFKINITEALSGIGDPCRVDGSSTGVTGTGTSQNVSKTGLICATTYTYAINCSDRAGNSNLTNVSYTTSACAVSDSGGSEALPSSLSYSIILTKVGTTISKNLRVTDSVKFKIVNETHTITVKSFSNSSAVVTVASTPQDVTINTGETKKFDLNGDNIYDIAVKYNGVFSKIFAKIEVTSIAEVMVVAEVTPDATSKDETIKETIKDSVQNITGTKIIWLWIVLGIILVIGLGWLGYKKIIKDN